MRLPFPYLQQFWDHRQLLWVADIDGIITVCLPLVANVAQVKDGWQQWEDPGGEQKYSELEWCWCVWIFIHSALMQLRAVQGPLVRLTVCVWQEETPPSPWPAEASQSHALDLLPQLRSSPAKQRHSGYDASARKPETVNNKAPQKLRKNGWRLLTSNFINVYRVSGKSA